MGCQSLTRLPLSINSLTPIYMYTLGHSESSVSYPHNTLFPVRALTRMTQSIVEHTNCSAVPSWLQSHGIFVKNTFVTDFCCDVFVSSSMTGGELFERIQQRGDSPFTERGRCIQECRLHLCVITPLHFYVVSSARFALINKVIYI